MLQHDHLLYPPLPQGYCQNRWFIDQAAPKHISHFHQQKLPYFLQRPERLIPLGRPLEDLPSKAPTRSTYPCLGFTTIAALLKIKVSLKISHSSETLSSRLAIRCTPDTEAKTCLAPTSSSVSSLKTATFFALSDLNAQAFSPVMTSIISCPLSDQDPMTSSSYVPWRPVTASLMPTCTHGVKRKAASKHICCVSSVLRPSEIATANFGLLGNTI